MQRRQSAIVLGLYFTYVIIKLLQF
jgi:hypothetical protein